MSLTDYTQPVRHASQQRTLKISLRIALIAAQLAASVTAAAASLLMPMTGNVPVAMAAGAVTGRVFNDLNANGAQDAAEGGVAGVSVTAWQSGTLPLSTTVTTDANGLYTFTLAAASARIEFTGLPFAFQSSPVGSGSNTSVRFVTTPASGVNFGIFQPSSYCQNNPQLVTACFTAGNNITGLDQNKTNVFSFPYTAKGIDPTLQTSLALAKQVGSVFGVAYQRSSKSVFVSAYTKRLASYGPGTGSPTSDGTGTIYRIASNGTVAPFVDLDDLFGAGTTGANPHTGFVPVQGDFDGGAYAAVGKTALGDIDISEDDSTLWTVNLADSQLYGLPIGNAAAPVVPTAAQVIRTPIPSPVCNLGTGRPFAVKPFNGLVYVGGVCTAENDGTSKDLQAYVYAFNPATSTWTATPVLQFPLNYPRTCVDIFPSYPTTCRTGVKGSLALWLPWRDALDTSFPNGIADGFTSYPQPMLSGIDFVPNGNNGTDMIVAFRDRFGDQIGSVDPGPQNTFSDATNPKQLNSVPAGDILRASLNAGAPPQGAWTIESNSQSNPPGVFGPTAGANSGQGPGNGEFFWGDQWTGRHDEIVYGGIVHVPGLSTTVATAMDPLRAATSGAIFLNNTTGAESNTYEVRAPVPYGQINNFDFRKANGMGDIEAMCDSAPIEIGNRVWLDADHNGIQDAGESPIANVQVRLTTSSGGVAVATTDAAGEYRFSSAIGTSTPNAVYNLFTGTVILAPFSSYTLTVDTLQPALATYSLTLPTADASPNGTARDSNGVLAGSVAVAPVTTGGPGANNHTYDFGFYAAAAPALLNLGNLVWYDTNNNGTRDTNEVGVDGVTLELYRDVNGDGVFTPGADGPALGTQTTSGGGFYNFINLTPGGYLVVIQGTQFAPGTPLYGYCNSTPSDSGNTDIDNRNHGNIIGPTTPGLCLSANNIVASTVVTLTPGGEPPIPVDTDGTNGNLTIDFGFYRMYLGNLVWNDLNRNGTWQPNEPGVPGVIVRLITPSATVIQTTTTSSTGIYTFTGLISGTYCGEIVLPIGFTNTVTVPTSLNPDNDVDNDNNGVTIIGSTIVRSNCMAMIPGTEPFITQTTGTSQNPTLDFGIWQPTIIILGKDSVPASSTPTQTMQVGVGTRITYTLSVRNDGVAPAQNVVLSDVIPADTAFVVGSATPPAAPVNNVISWTIPQLNPGQTSQVSFAVTVVSRNGVAVENTAYALSNQTPLTVSNRVVHVFTPTAVSLLSFNATATANSVVIEWATGLELNTSGFVLYRSATGNMADRTPINDQLIAAQGGNSSYRYEDTQVTAGTRYTYWLVEAELTTDGNLQLNEQGSTSVTFGATAPANPNNNVGSIASGAASIGGGVVVQGAVNVPANTNSTGNAGVPAAAQNAPQTQSVARIEAAPAAVQPANTNAAAVAAPAQAAPVAAAQGETTSQSEVASQNEVAAPVQPAAQTEANTTSNAIEPVAVKAEPEIVAAADKAVASKPVAGPQTGAPQAAAEVKAQVGRAAAVSVPAQPAAAQAATQEPARNGNVLWLAMLAGLTLVALAGAGLVVGVVRQARRRN